MCFRPAEAAKPVTCPSCGKRIPVVGGVKLKACPFCKTDLTAARTEKKDEQQEQKEE